jgi:hypothetical protein
MPEQYTEEVRLIMTEITRSPLCWPHHVQRTPFTQRKYGRFGRKERGSYGIQPITLAGALKRTVDELGSFTRVGSRFRCDPKSVIISTNLELRNDGLPRSGQRKPDDPGVAVYFILDGTQRCIPCDMYLRIEDNLAAIAATIESLRTIERHGSQMFNAAFSGFDALPPPDPVEEKSWREVLDYYGSDPEECERQYQRARKKYHPDHGGSDEEFISVQNAWKVAKKALSPGF